MSRDIFGLRPQIDISLPFVTKKEFYSNGQFFHKNVKYPWKELGIDARKLRILYDAGYISNSKKTEEQHQNLEDNKKKKIEEFAVDAPKTFLGLSVVEGDNGWWILYTREGKEVYHVRAKGYKSLIKKLLEKKETVIEKFGEIKTSSILDHDDIPSLPEE